MVQNGPERSKWSKKAQSVKMVQNYLTWSKTVQIFHMHFWSWNFRKILFFGTPCSWCFCWSWSLVKFTSLNEEPCLFSRQSEDRTSPNPIISLTFVVFWCSLRCFHICFDWAIDALCLDQNEKVVLAKHPLTNDEEHYTGHLKMMSKKFSTTATCLNINLTFPSTSCWKKGVC